MLSVGQHENIFILFLLAIKTAGLAQKLRVGQVSGNTAIFCLRLMLYITFIFQGKTQAKDSSYSLQKC